jgi:hypothetical protein
LRWKSRVLVRSGTLTISDSVDAGYSVPLTGS